MLEHRYMEGAAQAGERAAHEVWTRLAKLPDVQLPPPSHPFKEEEPPSETVPAAYSGINVFCVSNIVIDLFYILSHKGPTSLEKSLPSLPVTLGVLLAIGMAASWVVGHFVLKNYWKDHHNSFW